MKRFALAVVLTSSLAALAPIASADVLAVGPSRPFATPQAAVSAAIDGDVVLIEPGIYAGPVTIGDVELALVARAAAPSITGGVRVASLGASRSVVLAGLELRGGDAGDALAIVGCAGAVRVADCTLLGAHPAASPCTPGAGASVLDSADVALTRCRVRGAHAPDGVEAAGGVGLRVERSSVALHGCAVEGGAGGTDALCPREGFPYGDGLDGGSALELREAHAFVAASTLAGGRGGDADDTMGFVFGGFGGSAAVARASSVLELLDDALRAGDGGTAPPPSVPGGSYAVLDVDASSRLGRVVGAARDTSFAVLVESSSAVGLAIAGEPGDVVACFVAPTCAFEEERALHGVRLVPQDARFVRLGVVGGAGATRATLFAPAVAPGDALVLHVQTLHRDANGRFVLGPARPLVVLGPGS